MGNYEARQKRLKSEEQVKMQEKLKQRERSESSGCFRLFLFATAVAMTTALAAIVLFLRENGSQMAGEAYPTIAPIATFLENSQAVRTIPAACLIPDVIGLEQSVAEANINGLGVQVIRTTQYDPQVEAGNVVKQEPAPHTRLDPCQGEVVLTISLGLEPTQIPATLPPTLSPTVLLPSPTPDNRLFWDNFETVPKPEWVFQGNNYNLVNGELATSGDFQASVGVGNPSWINYRVGLGQFTTGSVVLRFRIRVQDESNYMELTLSRCSWHVTSNGDRRTVPNSSCRVPRNAAIEVEGPEYRLIDASNDEVVMRLVDDTLLFGGIMIVVDASDNSASFTLEEIEIYPLP